MIDHLFCNAHGERDAMFSMLAQWPLVRHYAIGTWGLVRQGLRRIRRR